MTKLIDSAWGTYGIISVNSFAVYIVAPRLGRWFADIGWLLVSGCGFRL